MATESPTKDKALVVGDEGRVAEAAASAVSEVTLAQGYASAYTTIAPGITDTIAALEYLDRALVMLEETGEFTTTDADGFWSFGDLAAGTYTVTASLDGYEPASCTSDITSGSGDWWCSVAIVPATDDGGDGDDGGAPDEDTGRPLLEVLAANDGPSVEQQLVVQQVRQALRAAIGELPERHRHCVMMYYDKEMSLAEIAAVYGVSVSRISQIISDARRRLRKMLVDQVDLADLVT